MATAAGKQEDTGGMTIRDAFARRYGELVDHLARTAPAETLADALASSDPFSGLADALGAAAALEAPRDAMAPARARAVEARLRILEKAGGALRVSDVAELLDISVQAVQARRGRGTVLALPLPNGEHVYPSVQFDGAGVLDGLRDVLAAFGEDVDPWTRLAVLVSASDRAGGRSAFELLQAGEVDTALSIAATYGEHLG